MKRSLLLLAFESSAKAIRTGFGVVGALTDCGMRGPVVRDSLWLTEAEEEIEVLNERDCLCPCDCCAKAGEDS